jgi:hypothetical protein
MDLQETPRKRRHEPAEERAPKRLALAGIFGAPPGAGPPADWGGLARGVEGPAPQPLHPHNARVPPAQHPSAPQAVQQPAGAAGLAQPSPRLLQLSAGDRTQLLPQELEQEVAAAPDMLPFRRQHPPQLVNTFGLPPRPPAAAAALAAAAASGAAAQQVQQVQRPRSPDWPACSVELARAPSEDAESPRGQQLHVMAADVREAASSGKKISSSAESFLFMTTWGSLNPSMGTRNRKIGARQKQAPPAEPPAVGAAAQARGAACAAPTWAQLPAQAAGSRQPHHSPQHHPAPPTPTLYRTASHCTALLLTLQTWT